MEEILQALDAYLPNIGGWEIPATILVSFGVVLWITRVNLSYLYKAFCFIERSWAEAVAHARKQLTTDRADGIARAIVAEPLPKIPAWLVYRIIWRTLLSVTLASIILFATSVFSFFRLREFSNIAEICDNAQVCTEIYAFSIDTIFKGLLFDIMETFDLSFSRITYSTSLNPFSISVLLIRAAPALLIISYLRDLAMMRNRARLEQIAAVFIEEARSSGKV